MTDDQESAPPVPETARHLAPGDVGLVTPRDFVHREPFTFKSGQTLPGFTLRYETYVMPAPEENAEHLYESVLRRNERLVGAHFSIGAEDALFLRGELPLALVCEAELDRIVGTIYDIVEKAFPSLIRIGFASRFADDD